MHPLKGSTRPVRFSKPTRVLRSTSTRSNQPANEITLKQKRPRIDQVSDLSSPGESLQYQSPKVVQYTRKASTSCLHLSPSGVKQLDTDKGLTFLQSAREKNIPVRSGKWNAEEERYLRKLVELFCAGILDDIENKASMRAWLSRMLNCCPMRISKKQMHGEKFIGKAKFCRNTTRIEAMTQNQYNKLSHELQLLRANFLLHWTKEEFARKSLERKRSEFNEWYAKVVGIVPEPRVARNPLIKPFRVKLELKEYLETAIFEGRATSQRSLKRSHQDAFKWTTVGELASMGHSEDDAPREEHTSQGLKQRLQSPIEVASFQSERRMAMDDDDSNVHFSLLMNSCLPVDMPSAPQSTDIVLDFGPPSLWNYLETEDSMKSDYIDFDEDDLLDEWAHPVEFFTDRGMQRSAASPLDMFRTDRMFLEFD